MHVSEAQHPDQGVAKRPWVRFGQVGEERPLKRATQLDVRTSGPRAKRAAAACPLDASGIAVERQKSSALPPGHAPHTKIRPNQPHVAASPQSGHGGHVPRPARPRVLENGRDPHAQAARGQSHHKPQQAVAFQHVRGVGRPKLRQPGDEVSRPQSRRPAGNVPRP